MSIYQFIDRDKVVQFLQHYWWFPLHRWLHGIQHEVIFLHELRVHFADGGNPIDIGVKQNALLQYGFALLHQQGERNVDQFGSDFALTIDVTGAASFRKTALFQTKVSDNHSAIVERRQIEQALADRVLHNRCFVMALDRVRSVIRVESVDVLNQEFSLGNQTQTFDTSKWEPSTSWICEWFECHRGEVSDPTVSPSIESLLARFVEQPSLQGYFPLDRVRSQQSDALGSSVETLLPRNWHYLSIRIEEAT